MASAAAARRVGEVRRVLVASPAYIAARGMPQEPGELARYDSVLASSRPVPPDWRFRAVHGAAGARVPGPHDPDA